MRGNGAKAVLAAVIAGVAWLFGALDKAFWVLFTLVCLDYVTGVVSAWYNKRLNSDVGIRGIGKKVLMFALVAVARQIDLLAGTEYIRLATIFFLCANEALSILENVGETGIPIPSFLTAALEKLKEAKGGASGEG